MIDTLIDYITGKEISYIGAEQNRQIFEKFLVKEKGYSKKDIKIDEKITVMFKNKIYISSIDIVIFCNTKAFMAVKCIAGSIGSYEREILAGARLLYDYQIPFSISTNGKDALIRNVITGKKYGQGLECVPSKKQAEKISKSLLYQPFSKEKKEREMIIFRSYNIEKINKCTGE